MEKVVFRMSLPNDMIDDYYDKGLKELPTKRLVEILRKARELSGHSDNTFDSGDYIYELKAELARREHVPKGKQEKKIVRRYRQKHKLTEKEVYDRYSEQIKEELKSQSDGKDSKEETNRKEQRVLITSYVEGKRLVVDFDYIKYHAYLSKKNEISSLYKLTDNVEENKIPNAEFDKLPVNVSREHSRRVWRTLRRNGFSTDYNT